MIGVTGGFCAGKTTVCNIFKELDKDIEVIDADEIAHKLLKIPDPEQRKKMAEEIFADEGRIRRWESTLHPLIIEEIKKRIEGSRARLILVDAPLLIETGTDKLVDKIIVVRASLDTQLSRSQSRGFSSQDALRRIKRQLPLSEKMKKADYLIENDKEIEETRKQVEEVWRRIVQCLK